MMQILASTNEVILGVDESVSDYWTYITRKSLSTSATRYIFIANR